MPRLVKVFFILLIIASTGNEASANLVTIEKEYYYQASELDSKVSSRAIAMEQVKRLVLEQVGTYVSSTTIVNDYQSSSDQITAVTAGIVGADIEKESWDGKTYYMKARCTVDPDEVARAINKVLQDQSQVAELEATKEKIDELLKEVEDLKSEVASLGAQEQDQGQYQGQNQGQYQDRYVYTINQVKALDLVQNSWTYYNAGQYQTALVLLNEAQVISPVRDPGINIARSFVYLRMNDRRRALEELSIAAKLDPKYRKRAYLNRAVVFQKTGDRNRALAEADRAVKYSPNYAYSYYQRATIHNDMGNKNRAYRDMRKAAQLGNKKAAHYLKAHAAPSRDRKQAEKRTAR